MNHWMFKCSDISLLVSRSMDEKLDLKTRIGIRLHLIVCHLCNSYRKQLLIIRKAVSKLESLEESEPEVTPLPDGAAQRIKNHLEQLAGDP